MAVSVFHKHVRGIIDAALPRCWTVHGWPGKEVDLCAIAGIKGQRLYADFYVEKDGTAFVVEVQSSLHDERGMNAWDGLDGHYRRIGRDDLKRQVCVRLEVPIVEVWPSMSDDEIRTALYDGVAAASHARTRRDETARRSGFSALAPGFKGTERKTEWTKRPIRSTGRLTGGQPLRKTM